MTGVARSLLGAVLAMAAGLAAEARDDAVRSAQWMEAAQRQAAEVQRRQRGARLRWEYERRRSGAHARMPNTLYASTPERTAVDLSCPVPVDEGARRIWRRHLDDGDPLGVLDARSPMSPQSRNSAVNVLSAGRHSGPPFSGIAAKSAAVDHGVQAGGLAMGAKGSAAATAQHVYLLPSASEPLREGFVRVVNHSAQGGEVRIDPVDDGGRRFDALTLAIGAGETVHFNSGDLETGNEGKGLSGRTGAGQGAWWLAFSSDLDIEVLAYIRTRDGFLTAMHDVAPADGNVRRVAIFNPGSNRSQVSRLRLVNPGAETARVTIRGMDDRGVPGTGAVSLSMDAGTAREITAAQLESGAAGLDGMLGDGSGKWRLEVVSEQPIVALSLLESPTDHLTNLSTVPAAPRDGLHRVPLFPAAGDASGRQGFVRVINRSASGGEVRIHAYDGSDWDYEPLTLAIGAHEVAHFNSDDLEQGNPRKGLSGATGAGEGDWRLELASELDIEALAYIRTQDGFLTAMHDVVPSAGNTHRIAIFNPGSNRNQQSLLRLVNPGDESAEVTVAGIDGNGASGAGTVTVSVPAGATRTVAAWELEDGGDGLNGALGDGAGKWQLTVTSDVPLIAISLLKSPTGHLTNLSTAPGRGATGNAGQETAEDVFRESISPIVQSKCVTCHVEGGASGNTRLVFVRAADDEDHLATNLAVFETFLAEVDDGAELILNKIQGVSHGGGIQVAAGTDEYAGMERFLGLLGEDVGSVAITPATLFDGVRMESARSTLRRAAIVLAGRIPTDEEYASIKTGGLASLRRTIRGLMQGPEFNEFLIRGANDRLLTDRDLDREVIPASQYFVEYTNERYRRAKVAGDLFADEVWSWVGDVNYGAARAPLELIAHVAENDLHYGEILTADYIMANPMAAKAYGAATEFVDYTDLEEFQPSEITSYYRNDDSKESAYDAKFGWHVTDPGNLATDYPHAGILNTTAFLLRYPSTATNRNRARSRWTYYHFLGLDIEKSASRTTDPVALADTNSPTMNNPACTACHTVMDPVAGTFQNYGNEGLYRDRWGGMDSLDELYKIGLNNVLFEIEAQSHAEREMVAAAWPFVAGENTVTLAFVIEDWDDRSLYVDRLEIRDSVGAVVDSYELEDAEPLDDCNGGYGESYFNFFCPGRVNVVVSVPAAGDYAVEVVAWGDRDGAELPALSVAVSDDPYREGDTWYRDMRDPGYGGEPVPDADHSLEWLARKIVADDRFAEATVRFWWPAVMGADVAEPPETENDADFEGLLLASNAQSAEVKRLARAFRRSVGGGRPYNLKDLLVEIVLSKWFRADSMGDSDAIRATALADAGGERLLTPEELSRKTVALTGFDWGRNKWHDPASGAANWTNADEGYGLLYGGIDSDGITKRGRDLTSVMAGVSERHAAVVACPVVLKDFYLVGEEDRRLFRGIDATITPTFEFGSVFEIEAAFREEREKVSVVGDLKAGEATVTLSFVNNERWFERSDGDRALRIDRVIVRNASGRLLATHELEDAADVRGCGSNGPENDHLAFYCGGSVDVLVDIPADGRYKIEAVAWADQHGDELAKLDVTVGTDTTSSVGARAIKAKLTELHDKLLGAEADESMKSVQAAFDLFVEVWYRNRDSEDKEFRNLRCNYDEDHYYFDAIADDIWLGRLDEDGYPVSWDWDRMEEFIGETEMADPHYLARTWVTMLVYLMTDYRYLHL